LAADPFPNRVFRLTALVLFMTSAVVVCASAQTPTHGLVIPAGHWKPLWSNESRLLAAKLRYKASPASFQRIRGGLCNDQPCRALHEAFVYQMSGRCAAANAGVVDTCGDALAWVRTADWYCQSANGLPKGGRGPGGCTGDQQPDNEGRWWGEMMILTYAWLRDVIPEAERAVIVARINTAVFKDLEKEWGGPTDVANNYHWGYTRNAILWALVSYNEPSTHTFEHPSLGLPSGALSAGATLDRREPSRPGTERPLGQPRHQLFQ
jgi:hypothetical protein